MLFDIPVDVYKRQVIRAGKIAVSKINHYFEIGESFNQESTLCGRSIIKNIKRARMCGYRIELHYVGVDSVDTVSYTHLDVYKRQTMCRPHAVMHFTSLIRK